MHVALTVMFTEASDTDSDQWGASYENANKMTLLTNWDQVAPIVCNRSEVSQSADSKLISSLDRG